MSLSDSRSEPLEAPAETRVGAGLRALRPKISIPLLSIFGGLLVWELISRYLIANKLFLASPSQIAVALVTLAGSGTLERHLAVSAGEFAVGFGIASLLGIALGLVMASSARAKQALQPWISGFYATPTVALAPLFILWVGIGIWSK